MISNRGRLEISAYHNTQNNSRLGKQHFFPPLSENCSWNLKIKEQAKWMPGESYKTLNVKAKVHFVLSITFWVNILVMFFFQMFLLVIPYEKFQPDKMSNSLLTSKYDFGRRQKSKIRSDSNDLGLDSFSLIHASQTNSFRCLIFLCHSFWFLFCVEETAK